MLTATTPVGLIDTDLFISHATADDSLVSHLNTALNAADISTWVDHGRGINYGDRWQAAIQNTTLRSRAARFGGFIHTYSMRQAVEDQAVVPLLYDGRLVELAINRDALDDWFERRTRDLTEAQKLDLKRKMSRHEEISHTRMRLGAIAYDIAEHYRKNYRDTGLKAQLATDSKLLALQYYQLLSEDEGINCAVVISAPDMREGTEDIDGDKVAPVQAF